MKISMINSTRKGHFSIEQSLSMLRDAGFDGVDFQIFGEAQDALCRPDFEDYYAKLGAYARDIGLEISQTHAPFPTYVADKSDAENEEIFDSVRRAIVASGKLGTKYVVVHPPVLRGRKYDELKAENRAFGLDFYNRLAPVAKAAGVKIAIENMWTYDTDFEHICPTTLSHAEELAEWCDALGREQFTVCLDIGHCPLTHDDPAKAIRILGERLEVLHVHDVDGHHDLHTAPFFGKIRWEEVCQALADIDYRGVLNLESSMFVRADFPGEVYQAALNLQASIARYLADEVERRKCKR